MNGKGSCPSIGEWLRPNPHRGIVLLSGREIVQMRRAGRLAAQLLAHLEPMVRPGMHTRAINDEAERWTQAHGATSAQLGYTPPGHTPFPASICTSINEVVCHGIPDRRRTLHDGDIVNIDVTLLLDGYHGDTSKTFMVGEVSPKASRLVEVTRACMMAGIAAIAPGGRVGDIGAAIWALAEANGYAVVREMVGHGIGKVIHAEPPIPHFGVCGSGPKLRPGMAFTVEPMLNEGRPEIEIAPDGWTVFTKDRKLSAQWEHTVLVTEMGVEIMTVA
nr:type I methionyl aminopeptidase [Gloeobacter morelensis]